MSTNIVEYFGAGHGGSAEYSTGVLISFSFNFLVVVLGTLGSLAILISYAKGTDSTPHRMLIVSMIFADFLLSLTDVIAIPLHFAFGWRLPNVNPVNGCMADSTFLIIASLAEIFSFAAIAGERYLVVVRGVYNHNGSTKIVIIAIWAFSTLVSLLFLISPDLFQLNTGLLICLPNFTSNNVSARILNSIVIFVFAVCLCLIAIFYYLVYAFSVQKNRESNNAHLSEVVSAKEKKLLIKLLTITGVFMVSNTPILIQLLYEFISSTQAPFWFSTLSIFSLHINYTINPVILYNLDPIIRADFNYIFGIKRAKSSALPSHAVEGSSRI